MVGFEGRKEWKPKMGAKCAERDSVWDLGMATVSEQVACVHDTPG